MNHMNTKTVIGLGAAAALAIIAAVAITTSRKPVVDTAAAAAYAFPGLRDHLNEVASLAIAGAGNAALVTLEKSGEGWQVKEKGGYTADLGEIRGLLLKLADAKLLEPKTANEQRYTDLGVEDTAKPDAKSVLVTITGFGEPQRLIVGKSATRGGGTFVRRPDDKQSWLTAAQLTINKDPANWIERTITDIGSDRVKEATLTRPDGKVLRLFKQAGDANFKVADLPKGRQLSSEVAANSIGSALSALRLEDVQPAAQLKAPADGKVQRAQFNTFDGLTVDVTGWKQGDKHYLQLRANLDTNLAEAAIRAEQEKARADHEAAQKQATEAKTTLPAAPQAVADPARHRDERLKALQAEYARLQRRFDGWTYQVPAYAFGNLDKSMDELLSPAEAGKPVIKPGAGKKK